MSGNGQSDAEATALYVLSFPVYIHHRPFPPIKALYLHRFLRHFRFYLKLSRMSCLATRTHVLRSDTKRDWYSIDPTFIELSSEGFGSPTELFHDVKRHLNQVRGPTEVTYTKTQPSWGSHVVDSLAEDPEREAAAGARSDH